MDISQLRSRERGNFSCSSDKTGTPLRAQWSVALIDGLGVAVMTVSRTRAARSERGAPVPNPARPARRQSVRELLAAQLQTLP